MQSELECCSNVDNELQKVLSRFESVNSHSQETLENAIRTLESIQQELQQQSYQPQFSATPLSEYPSSTQSDDLITTTGLYKKLIHDHL